MIDRIGIQSQGDMRDQNEGGGADTDFTICLSGPTYLFIAAISRFIDFTTQFNSTDV